LRLVKPAIGLLFPVLFLSGVQAGTPSWLPGRLAIELEEVPAGSLTGRSGIGELDRWIDLRGGGELRSHFPFDVADLQAWTGHRTGAWLLLDLDPSIDIPQACRELMELAGVRSACPDWLTHMSFIPDDPLFEQQWSLNNTGQALSENGEPVGVAGMDIGAPAAWDWGESGAAAVVALLDTGVDPDNWEFSTRLLPGFNFLTNLPGAVDDNGHGTKVCGIIAAAGNNSVDLAGIAWGVEILPLKVFNSIGQGSASALANALNFARQSGVQVANFSGGLPNDYPPAAVQIEAGLESGMLTVAAAGNSDLAEIEFPARHPDCVAVGAYSPCGNRKTPESCDGEDWWGSNWGPELDLLAPGTRLLSTGLGGSITWSFNGTSAAAAHVSGAATLLAAGFPEIGPLEIRELLAQSADDMGSPGHDAESGYGRLRMDRAIEFALPPRVRNLRIETPYGASVRLEWDPLDGTETYVIEAAACREASPQFEEVARTSATVWTRGVDEIRRGCRIYRVYAVLSDLSASSRETHR